MIDLYSKFTNMSRGTRDTQFLINGSGVVKAYYGVNKDGLFRLSFLSTKNTDIKEDTKSIMVTSGNSSKNNFWTCFDLKNEALLPTFCTFGEDLVSCVVGEEDEKRSVERLKARFATWLALFKKNRAAMSIEQAKGLYGELYFIDNYLLEKYGEYKTIDGWSGPDNYSKDFAIDDDWFEIKTTSALAATIKISSLQQLSSDVEGRLIVVRTEEMSEAFRGYDSSINELCVSILSKISDGLIRDEFLNKVSNVGYDFSDGIGNKKYRVEKIEKFIVNEDFPIIRERDLSSKAINNVSYELIIKMLDDYREL